MSDDDTKNPEDFASDSDVDDEKAKLKLSRDSSPLQSRSPSPAPQTTPDSRFTQPTPSPFKRAALLLFIGFLLWIALEMRFKLLEATRKPQIIHASRYVAILFRLKSTPIYYIADIRKSINSAQQLVQSSPKPSRMDEFDCVVPFRRRRLHLPL